MRNTTYRQPEWYRYVAAFAGEKDVVVVENPYGGVVPELIGLLGEGKGHDLFRLSLFEAAAMGVNMSVPYGSWMGSVIEDSFYAPHGLAKEIQQFLGEHERYFARRTANEVAVVYSVEITRELIGRADASDNTSNRTDETVVVPYRAVTRALSQAAVPYDVVIWADGITAPDRAAGSALARYPTVVLPDVHALTHAQLLALEEHLSGGGSVVVTDRFGDNLPVATRSRMLARVQVVERDIVDQLLPQGTQVVTAASAAASVATNLHHLDDGDYALHVVNYDYVSVDDAVRPVLDVSLRVRLPRAKERATMIVPDGRRTPLAVSRDGSHHVVQVEALGVYSIVVFHDAELP
jgi:hypothetical protein